MNVLFGIAAVMAVMVLVCSVVSWVNRDYGWSIAEFLVGVLLIILIALLATTQ